MGTENMWKYSAILRKFDGGGSKCRLRCIDRCHAVMVCNATVGLVAAAVWLTDDQGSRAQHGCL